MNKKAVFDVAIYAIPSVFLLVLIMAIFSLYFAVILKDAPSIEISRIDDDTITLINYLKTPVNDKETISDLIRNSIERNDFTELDEKTSELFKDFNYKIGIYEQNNIPLKEIGNHNLNPNTQLTLPTKEKTVIIKFYIK